MIDVPSSLIANSAKSNVIVADCDEVLVRISPKWVYLMHEQYERFAPYFNLSKNFDVEVHAPVVLNRPVFYLNDWLGNEHLKSLYGTDEGKQVLEDMKKLYTGDYYANLQPTATGRALSQIIKNSLVKRLVVVSRVSTNLEVNESKTRFLKALFSGYNHKLQIYYVEPGEAKSEAFNLLNEDVNIIYEDELSNIEDLAQNASNIDGARLMIPSYGYNSAMDPSLKAHLENRGIDIRYYNDL